MTLLTVWAENDSATHEIKTADLEEITAILKDISVRFERWELAELGAGATRDDVLAAYHDHVSVVIAREGYKLVDVAQLSPSKNEGWPAVAAEARAKFLSEHTHEDDEDRFFAVGSGTFYLHRNSKVYAVLCEAGDLLSVPAGATHWFDMGTSPHFIAIRFFHDDDGWIGEFTGSAIASRFPTHDQIVAAR